MIKKYVVLDVASRSEWALEIHTREVAGAFLARIYPEKAPGDGALKAADGCPREWSGPSEDYAVLEADRWLRNRYEVKSQDTVL